jgi:hypothetical protein
MIKIAFEGIDNARFNKLPAKNGKRSIKFGKRKVSISQDAAKTMGIKSGSYIRFDHEAGKPKAWYVMPGQEHNALLVKEVSSKNRAASFFINSSSLCEYVIEKSGHSLFILAPESVGGGAYFLIPKG